MYLLDRYSSKVLVVASLLARTLLLKEPFMPLHSFLLMSYNSFVETLQLKHVWIDFGKTKKFVITGRPIYCTTEVVVMLS